MPRYVVLQHESPRGLHWDFMLELSTALATWALPEPPDATRAMLAEALPDHRLDYLDYEGPISGGRGSVTRWDTGTYVLKRRSGAELVVTLEGERLAGTAAIERTPGDPTHWQFSFTADRPTHPGPVDPDK
jgi:hypothetical protein